MDDHRSRINEGRKDVLFTIFLKNIYSKFNIILH